MTQRNEVYFSDLYTKLAAPFDETFKDVRGGIQLEYITGFQCVTRLNEVLGVAGWSFTVREHGINEQADEAWALGSLVANFGGTLVVREQFGSQKIKRSRQSGQPLDIGYDLKGASTDALKKCAMAIGVGLYLSKKEPQTTPAANSGYTAAPAAVTRAPAAPTYKDPQGGTVAEQMAASEVRLGRQESLPCDECSRELTETRFKDGAVWSPEKLAEFGQNKHQRTLCMSCYRAANDAVRLGQRP